jgi:cytidylate kinase
MAARTVTFSVQIGSRGFEIARLVAERLKYRYYDWEVTSEAAREAGVSAQTVAAAEQATSGFKRIMERLFAASAFVPDDTTLEGPNTATMEAAIRTLTSDDYRGFIERVVADLAVSGEAVIVGHASQLVLKEEPAVLKVLVCGSKKARAERLALEEGMAAEAAALSVQASDRERINFFKQVYKADLLDATLYDLALNTDHVPVEAAVELVLQSAAKLSN